jgi:phospholipase C
MVMIQAASVALLALTAVAAHPQGHGSSGSHGHSHNGADWTKNIKNVVVLVQENRSFDTLAGGFTYDSSIDGLVGKQFCNPMNITEPTKNIVCADKIAPAHDVAVDDPNHSVTGTSFGLYSTYHPDEAGIKAGKFKATLKGFVQEQQVAHGFTGNESRASEIINYYTSAHIPVFEDMAKNYVLFDQWFCDVPGPTNPNRAYVRDLYNSLHICY